VTALWRSILRVHRPEVAACRLPSSTAPTLPASLEGRGNVLRWVGLFGLLPSPSPGESGARPGLAFRPSAVAPSMAQATSLIATAAPRIHHGRRDCSVQIRKLLTLDRPARPLRPLKGAGGRSLTLLFFLDCRPRARDSPWRGGLLSSISSVRCVHGPQHNAWMTAGNSTAIDHPFSGHHHARDTQRWRVGLLDGRPVDNDCRIEEH
jgi:hypothetical protein